MQRNEKDLKPQINLNGILSIANLQLVLKMIETPSFQHDLWHTQHMTLQKQTIILPNFDSHVLILAKTLISKIFCWQPISSKV